jgi:ABC-type Fe3+/spermidine/putrescine transport system ATPase subunit
MTSQTPPTSPEVQLVDLEKRFREVRAVDGVSLEIRTGEFFSLLGPSGCGKTTTLRMIGGFEVPTGGRILLRGRDVTDAPPDKRPVNMVFQNYALFPHLDVGDNVAFGLKRRSVAKPEINAISTIVVALTALARLVAWRLGAFRTEEPRTVDEAEPEGAAA